MSQPKRWRFFSHIDYKLMEIDSKMIEWPDGSYVLYSDYAALAAENERLKAEVKRLTTALKTADRVIKPLRDAAAKEGRDAK